MLTSVNEKEGRRLQRIALPLPARVDVKLDSSVSWNEVTRLNDVSAFGAGFTLKRPVKRGRLVMLTVPMPRQLRCYDFGEPQYRIWALVRRCFQVVGPNGDRLYSIGAAFIGKQPPTDYLTDPSKLYEISHREDKGLWHLTHADVRADESQLPKDIRRQTRFFIPETLRLEMVDGSGNVTMTETTVTENLSLGGAAVFTSLNVNPGDFLRVSCDRSHVTIISIVRGKRVGLDGMTRLHLEFVDNYFPLEGLE